MKKVNDIIKEQRLELGLQNKELARLIGVTPSTVSKYETGRCIPNALIIIRLANAFKVSTDYLIGLENDYEYVESFNFYNENEYKLDQKLKELRQKLGLSQDKLAEILDMNGSSISTWERKQFIPNADVIAIFCRFFNVRADYLLGLEN